MSLQGILNKTEAYLQQEIGAQQVLLKHLAEHERIVREGTAEELEEATGKLLKSMGAESTREARRQELRSAMAKELKLPAHVLTFGSIAERLGEPAARMNQLRLELIEAVRKVRKAARRLVSVAKSHAEVMKDVMKIFLGSDAMDAPDGGVLLDAEA